jgi:hypothetical protein
MARRRQPPQNPSRHPQATTLQDLRERILADFAVLRVPLTAEHLDAALSRAAQEGLSHLEFLHRLLTDQATLRRERSTQRRIKDACFRELKTLASFDWEFNAKTIRRLQIEELANGDFIRRRQNVVFVGQSGVGKSFLVQSIGQAACALGYLDVAVDHAVFVGVLQTERRLANEVAGVGHLQWPLLLDVLRQVGPLDELHDQEVRAACLVGVVRRDDVGVMEFGRRLHFTMEALDSLGIADELRIDDLQSHQPVHDLVPRLVDRPHSALAEQIQDLELRMVGQVGRWPAIGPVGHRGVRRGRGRDFHHAGRRQRLLAAHRLAASRPRQGRQDLPARRAPDQVSLNRRTLGPGQLAEGEGCELGRGGMAGLSGIGHGRVPLASARSDCSSGHIHRDRFAF